MVRIVGRVHIGNGKRTHEIDLHDRAGLGPRVVMHVRGFDADLKAPWAVVTPSSRDIASALGNEKDRVIPYHLVTEGECVVTVEGASTQLAAGDMALFPQGHVHVMASHAGVAPLPMTKEFVQEVLARRSVLPIRFGGDGKQVKLLCGFFALE